MLDSLDTSLIYQNILSIYINVDDGIGRNGLPDMNPSCVRLLDFFASHNLSTTKTCSTIKVSISTPGTRTPKVKSMINLVVVSAKQQPEVSLFTQVKREVELSTDSHLVVSWISLQGKMPDRAAGLNL